MTCVAVCCSVLHCVAVCSMDLEGIVGGYCCQEASGVMPCVVVSGRVRPCVAVFCRVLPSVFQRVALRPIDLEGIDGKKLAVCCSACCSVLQRCSNR